MLLLYHCYRTYHYRFIEYDVTSIRDQLNNDFSNGEGVLPKSKYERSTSQTINVKTGLMSFQIGEGVSLPLA